jgi:hypothetical protein
MPFLPDNYVEPSKKDDFFKPKEGKNKVRILGGIENPRLCAIGFQIWERWRDGEKDKPHRFLAANLKSPKPPAEVRPIIQANHNRYQQMYGRPMSEVEQQNDNTSKLFYAVVIWNYDLDMIQVWEITQVTIRNHLASQSLNPDWGDPYDVPAETKGGKKQGEDHYGYDIEVNKKVTGSGKSKKTEYILTYSMPKPVDPRILEELEQADVDIRRIFEGGYPISDGAPVQPDDVPFRDSPEVEARIERIRNKKNPDVERTPKELVSYFTFKLEEIQSSEEYSELGGRKGLQKELNDIVAKVRGEVDPTLLDDMQALLSYVDREYS